MYHNHKTGILGIVITIILLILIVVFSNGENNASFFENVASKLVMPVQNGLTYLKNKISGNDTFFTDINKLKEENEQLLAKNSELEQSLRELENIKTENETLRYKMNELNKEVYNLKNELSRFKALGLGFYVKKSSDSSLL